jgi:hypothetical protein
MSLRVRVGAGHRARRAPPGSPGRPVAISRARIAAAEVFMAVSSADGAALADATAAFEQALLAAEGAPGPEPLLRAAVQAGNAALAAGAGARPAAWLVALVAEGSVVLGRSGHWNAGLQRGSDFVPVFGQAVAGAHSGAGVGLEEILRLPVAANDSLILAPGELFRLDSTSLMVTCRARAPQAAADGLVDLLNRSGAPGDIAVQVLRFQDEAAASAAIPRPPAAPAGSDAPRVPPAVPGWAWMLVLVSLVLGLSLVAGALFWMRRDEARAVQKRATRVEATPAPTSRAAPPRAVAAGPTPAPRSRPKSAEPHGAAQARWRSAPLVRAPAGDSASQSPTPSEPGGERVTTVHVLLQNIGGADTNALFETLGKTFPGRSVSVVGVLANQTGDVATGVVYWRPAGRGLAEAVAKTLGYEARQFPPSLESRLMDTTVLLVPAGPR